MKKNTSYIIVAFPEDKVIHKFTEVKKHFNLLNKDKLTDKNNVILQNTAHITLKYPFYLNKNEEYLTQTLDEIDFEPINLSVDTLEVFKTNTHGSVLVARPQMNKNFFNLHKRIYHSVKPFVSTFSEYSFEPDNLKPHLSILYYIPEELVHEAEKYIQKNIIPFTFTINTITLLRKNENNQNEREIIKRLVATS